jgi:hypothetical protein
VLKLGLPDWVSLASGWTGPTSPANPTGNPNFNLKNRPEVNKSGSEFNKIWRNYCLTDCPIRRIAPFNGLSVDGLSFDGLKFDGLSFDGSSVDGLSFDGLSFDGSSVDGLSFDGLPWHRRSHKVWTMIFLSSDTDRIAFNFASLKSLFWCKQDYRTREIFFVYKVKYVSYLGMHSTYLSVFQQSTLNMGFTHVGTCFLRYDTFIKWENSSDLHM